MITYYDAGLPDIWGRWVQEDGGDWAQSSGTYNGLNNAIFGEAAPGSNGFPGGDMDSLMQFLASRSNPIYGRSKTVQPSAVTMNFYIRAK